MAESPPLQQNSPKNPESFLPTAHFRTKLGKPVNHPSEDELEAYLLGRQANDAQLVAIEEHLLICGPCVDWLEAQEHIISIMREYLRRPVVKPERKVKPKTMTANQGWLF
jgi:hypothetical protein